jgi:hypothetical protein
MENELMSLFSFLGNNANWLGPAIGLGGALLSGDQSQSGGPQSSNTSTQVNTPWSGAVPLLNDSMNQVQGLYNSDVGTQYYPGQTYTPMGWDTSTALNQMRERAMNGSPVNDAAQNSLMTMMDGGNNPYLDGMVDRSMDKVGDRVNSLFSKAGRYGSEAHQETLTENLGEVANSMYGSQYNADQNRSLSAIGMAPGIAETDYTDAGKLLGIGSTVENYQNLENQDQMARWNFNNSQPFNRANEYANLATQFGGMGGSQTGSGTQTAPGNTMAQNFGNWQQIGNLAGGMFGGFQGNQADWSNGSWANF